MAVKIKDLSILDRPRERLVKYGSKSLSDSELLSILISSGNYKYSAKDLAAIVLKKCGGIKNLFKLNYTDLIKINGIKQSKACILLATIEIINRSNIKVADLNGIKINNSKLVFDYYKNKLGSIKQECFYCLYLDNNKKVISDKMLFKGTINYSLVHPREIFKEAYLLSASGIICVHNHPSGNVKPSKQDMELTSNLVSLGEFHGIKILDHVIISNSNYYSFLENNQIPL